MKDLSSERRKQIKAYGEAITAQAAQLIIAIYKGHTTLLDAEFDILWQFRIYAAN